MSLQFSILTYGAAPTSGRDCIQQVAITGGPTGGTFTLTYSGQTTAAIPYNATAAQVQAALQALSNIGAGNVICASGPLPGTPITCTFAGTLAGGPIAAMTSTDSLTGGASPASAITTPTTGIKGTFRGASAGAYISDTTNGNLYQNLGTAQTPVWTSL